MALSGTSFPYLADDLFRPVRSFQLIRAEGPEPFLGEQPIEPGLIRIAELGGQDSPLQLEHYLNYLQAGWLVQLQEILTQVQLNDRPQFADLLDRKFRRAALLLLPGQPQQPAWNPSRMQVIYNGKEVQDPMLTASVCQAARRYAVVYAALLNRIRGNLRTVVFSAVFGGVAATAVPPAKRSGRLLFNGSVKHLGAFFRVLVDREIIKTPVIAELTRSIAGLFSTPRQEEISPKSLRNAFEDPSPEVLEQVLSECRLFERYLERLIERQRR